ncbi:MAG: Serine/threonine phosphatase stp [Candidatus Anoxychlamydiales bacterium]|nr:Serine/threonine phosphatase stp [Candidatus Anoxychlamydiales bacterium]
MDLKIEVYGLTDIGHIRKKNEDVFEILEDNLIFSVADGMGGHKAGDIAAQTATKEINNLLLKTITSNISTANVIYHINLAIKEVNSRIYNLSRANIDFLGMGTTLCFLHLRSTDAIFAHVGDSRIYHYKKNSLIQLTKDHSLINKLKDQNKVFNKKSCKNIITKAIGTYPKIEPSVNSTPYDKGDIFLLTTDGLTDYISNENIKILIETFEDPKNLCEILIKEAKNNGSSDNITALVIKIVQK